MKLTAVQSHGILSLFVDEFDCSNTKSVEPVLFWTSCFACFQVIPCASFPVLVEQFRVMLEPGSTVMGSVCWHPEQEDFISHFMSAADEVPAKWRERQQYCLIVNWPILAKTRLNGIIFYFSIYSNHVSIVWLLLVLCSTRYSVWFN